MPWRGRWVYKPEWRPSFHRAVRVSARESSAEGGRGECPCSIRMERTSRSSGSHLPLPSAGSVLTGEAALSLRFGARTRSHASSLAVMEKTLRYRGELRNTDLRPCGEAGRLLEAKGLVCAFSPMEERSGWALAPHSRSFVCRSPWTELLRSSTRPALPLADE